MSERHLETHGHREPAETAEWCCSEQRSQQQSELQEQSRGEGEITSNIGGEPRHRIVVPSDFQTNHEHEQNVCTLSDGCGNRMDFTAQNFTNATTSAIFTSAEQPLLWELTFGTMYCTGPTKKIILTWHPKTSIQNRSRLHPALTAIRFQQEEERGKKIHATGTTNSPVT